MDYERQNKWLHYNMWVISTKLTQTQYRRFKKLCQKHGMTTYRVLQWLVLDWMAQKIDGEEIEQLFD